jgi:hypothetical protein
MAMDRKAQIDLLKRLLLHLESKTTSLADLPWWNDTSVYFDPEHLAREEHTRFSWASLRTGLRPVLFVPTIMPACQSLSCAGAMANFARS